ncbi:MAG: enoyl-CoA hydratase [Gammaproteobacteria bacterium]|nr:enoyl-CoA hydratase [Gammaproteobacteria bacterium]
MSYKYIKVDVEDRLYIVTINRPKVHNALSPDTNFELHEAFNEFENNPDLWVAIITGAGEVAFSVGGDISVMVDAKTDDDYKIPESGYGGLTDRHNCHKPIIAAVNGMALGGGFETAMACDLIVASDKASFGLPEPKIGTAAVGSGMHRIVREIGLKPAMALLLTGDSIDANKALELGLVNEVVPSEDVMNSAREYARRILKCAPLAVQSSKQCALQGLEYNSVRDAMQAQHDGKFDRLDAMMKGEDIREGLTAFMEKRKPVWKGR